MSDKTEKIWIDCRNVTLGYEDQVVWEGLTFQVLSGDYLCIVGENGSGKSTLLKSLLGLLKPLSGTIVWDDALRRGAIGYLPQQTRAQKDFPATAYEVVLSGFLSAGGIRFFHTPAEKSAALMNMGKLGILELKDRCYRELSGGQQQRVLLARALCATSKLLFLDEPVSGLDPRVTAEMYALIRRLNREDGITILMISHDLAAAVQEATHILHVGSELFFGTKEAYLSSPMAGRFLIREGGDVQ